MTETQMREWEIRDARGELRETIMATSPNEAFDLCVSTKKTTVTLHGETEGWTPGMGEGELYGAFRACGFSHSEVARALCALGYRHNTRKAGKGGALNERQTKLVEKLRPMSQELRMAWARRMAEYGALSNAAIKATVRKELHFEAVKAWMKDPKTDAQLKREAEAEADLWWEKEGRFEAEIEERGESKYYHYEKEKAELGGMDISAQDYLDGKTADDGQ